MQLDKIYEWQKSVNLCLGQLTPKQSPDPEQRLTEGTKREITYVDMNPVNIVPTPLRGNQRQTSPSKRQRVHEDDHTEMSLLGRNNTYITTADAEGPVPFDTVSASNSAADFLKNAPYLLEADRTASKQTTSHLSSPTRQLQDRMKRARLRQTTPKFFMGTLPKQKVKTILGPRVIGDLEIPNHIVEIMDKLDPYMAALGCIPANIREKIISTWPETARSFPQSFFGDSSEEGAVILDFVKRVYEQACKAFREYMDEPAWQAVAENILEFGLPNLNVVMAQTKLVYSELLPTVPGGDDEPVPIARVIVDLHIALKDIEGTEDMIKRASRRSPTGSASAFHSPQADNGILTALVEVKGMHGIHEEAIYQCSVASAALQKRLLQIAAESDNESAYQFSQPVVNFIVLGHSWFLHLVFRQTDGSVRVLGPTHLGGTATPRDIFVLLRVLRNYEDWVTQKYWPFLEEVYR